MSDPSRHVFKVFHHRQLGDSTGAIAGLASGVSVIVGLIAAHYTPHGFSRLRVALHLAKEPLILKLAPVIAGLAVALATASGLLRFYTWWKESQRTDQAPDSRA